MARQAKCIRSASRVADGPADSAYWYTHRKASTSDVWRSGGSHGARGVDPMPDTARTFAVHCRRWTERDAREVLAALDRSGKSVSVFAAEHGLDPQRVYCNPSASHVGMDALET